MRSDDRHNFTLIANHPLHAVRNSLRGRVGFTAVYKPIGLSLSKIGSMIRSGHAASLTRSSLRHVPSSTARTAWRLARTYHLKQQNSRASALPKPCPLALSLYKPFSTSLQRYATTSDPGKPIDKIDRKHEEVVEREKIEAHPEEVSVDSSVHQVFHEKGVEEPEKDEDMLAGVKADIVGLLQGYRSHGHWTNV